MEGICGIIGWSSAPTLSEPPIDHMTYALTDGEALQFAKISGDGFALAYGGWTDANWPPITFLHREDNLVIVGVADIYNLDELATQYHLTPQNTGALLLACYRANSKSWPLQIRGNFAVIIVDTKAQQFTAATDRIGIRPLFWSKQNNFYYLSSRLKSLQRVAPDLQINAAGVYAYMRHSMIPSPYTIYTNVYKLAPGFLLNGDGRDADLKKYWDIFNRPQFRESEDQLAEKVYSRISEAVTLMKNGIARENEIGCFLSGGTDSSSICGLLSKKLQKPVAAYSIGFPENGYDEMFYARVAAKAFALNHHQYYIQPPDVLQVLPDIVTAYDEPFGNASAIPTFYCVRNAAENGVRLMFAGDGGDEIFAGNARYGEQQRFRNYFKVPGAIRHLLLEPLLLNRLEKLPLKILRKGGSYIRRARLPELKRLDSYRYVTDSEMFAPGFLSADDIENVNRISEQHFNGLPEATTLDRHLYLDMKLTITDNDLRKVTRMCELAHMRVRYPMLDHAVIELGFRIPPKLKLRGTNGLRYIFKRAFRDLLPPEILAKPKQGFGLPISQWLRDDPRIKELAHNLLFDRRHLQRGYFQPGFIRKLWDLQLTDNTPYYGAIIWQLVMLEAWHRVHLDGEILAI